MAAAAEQVREQLADEIKNLATSVNESIKTLSADVNDLRADFREFKGAVNRDLRYILLIGCGLIAFLAWGVKKGFDLSYQAGALTNQVESNAAQTNQRFDQLEKRMDKTDAKVDERFNKLEAKVDQVLQRLDQVVAKPKS